MSRRKKVLITGASGLIGSILGDAMNAQYDVTGVDIVNAPVLDTLIADTTDLDAIYAAFDGVDAVIDLAAMIDRDTAWDHVYSNNIPSTYNVLEASRRAGVKRVVFASSNHTTGLYENDYPYSDIVAGLYDGLDSNSIPLVDITMPVRPDGPYGIGKIVGEVAGRYYSERYGLSVICLRIGTVNRENRPLIPRHFSTLLTHRDLVNLVISSLEAPSKLTFAIFYGVSNNTWRFWDISDSEQALGYLPKDNAESWRRDSM